MSIRKNVLESIERAKKRIEMYEASVEKLSEVERALTQAGFEPHYMYLGDSDLWIDYYDPTVSEEIVGIVSEIVNVTEFFDWRDTSGKFVYEFEVVRGFDLNITFVLPKVEPGMKNLCVRIETGTKKTESIVYKTVCLDENGVPYDTDGNVITDSRILAQLGVK